MLTWTLYVRLCMPSQSSRSDRLNLLLSTLDQLMAAAPSETGTPAQPCSLASHHDPATLVVIDLLISLGALSLDSSQAQVSVASLQGGYFLRLLHALLELDAPIVADWESHGVTTSTQYPFDRAVNLLAALEQRRLDLCPDAAPIRQVIAAIGLISCRLPIGERAFLVHWDEAARAWQLIGGRFEERDGSLRQTLVRELAEELACAPLREGYDVQLTEVGAPFSIERVSPTFGLLSRTTFHMFGVRFIRSMPALHKDLRWTTEAELLAGMTADRQIIAAEPFKHLCRQQTPAFDRQMTDACQDLAS